MLAEVDGYDDYVAKTDDVHRRIGLRDACERISVFVQLHASALAVMVMNFER